jgi:hypothetical protein
VFILSYFRSGDWTCSRLYIEWYTRYIPVAGNCVLAVGFYASWLACCDGGGVDEWSLLVV